MRLSFETLSRLAVLGDVDALNTMEKWEKLVQQYSKVGIECYFQLAHPMEEELDNVGMFFLHTYTPRFIHNDGQR